MTQRISVKLVVEDQPIRGIILSASEVALLQTAAQSSAPWILLDGKRFILTSVQLALETVIEDPGAGRTMKKTICDVAATIIGRVV